MFSYFPVRVCRQTTGVVNRARRSEPVVNIHRSMFHNTCGMTWKSNRSRASFLSQWKYSC